MTEGKRGQRTGYLVEAWGEVGDDGRMGEGDISTGYLSTYSLGLGTCPRAWSGCPPYSIQHMSIPVVWHRFLSRLSGPPPLDAPGPSSHQPGRRAVRARLARPLALGGSAVATSPVVLQH